MKQAIIRFNDFLCCVVIAIVLIAAAIMFTINPLHALIFGVVGMVVCSLMFGMWFAISTIAQESVEQTKLLQSLVNKDN